MANSGRIITGTTTRLLQLGVDKIIQHFDKDYMGIVDSIFTSVSTDKGFYELLQLAGMGIATLKGEGSTVQYDSINQDFNARYFVQCFQKAARISYEAIQDNLYEDMLGRLGKAVVYAHKENRDFQGAAVLNNATVTNWGDTVPLLSTAHPLQAGGVNSNRLSPDVDLSEDALEQAIILADNFVNPNGLTANVMTTKLIIPTALRFVAERIVGSKYRTSTADNDINAVMNSGGCTGYQMWKRLTGSTSWFLQTNAEDGLMMVEREGISTKYNDDPFSRDTIVTSFSRFRPIVGDHRCLIGSVGP